MSRTVIIWIVCAIAVSVVCIGQAPRTPLPDVDLVGMDGNPVATDQLPQQGQWLLIYVGLRCSECEAFLKSVNVEEHPEIAARAVIVVAGASAEDVQAMTGGFPEWSGAAWYADPRKDAISRLKLGAVPVAFGMRGNSVAWNVKALPAKARHVESILRTWVQQ